MSTIKPEDEQVIDLFVRSLAVTVAAIACVGQRPFDKDLEERADRIVKYVKKPITDHKKKSR